VKATVAEVKSRLCVRPNKQEGIQNYDIDNAYPQRIRNAKKSSGRTTQCVNIYARFVRGGGFKEPFFKIVVNERKRLTLDKLHRKLVNDYALYKGFAVHVNYNMLGEITSMDHVPFEETRLGLEDDFGVVSKIKQHPDWGRESGKFDKSRIAEFDIFNPDPDAVNAQATAAGGFHKYKGQIFWWSANGPGKYPEASCDPVLEDVVADDESKQFRLNNISTNFLSPTMFKVDEFEDEDDEKAFDEAIEQFQGARKAGKIFVAQKNKSGGDIEVQKIEVQSMDGLFEKTENSTRESIRSNYMLLPVLLGDLVAGKLGTAQEIQDAYTFTNSIVIDDQMIQTEVFTELFLYWHKENERPADLTVEVLTYGNVKPSN
jgi:hypothetical protein